DGIRDRNVTGVQTCALPICHIHMLVTIPPKYSVAQIVGYLKGKSSLMIFEKYANMKYKYGNRHFWCRGYYVDTVGKNTKAIAERSEERRVGKECGGRWTQRK